MSDIDIACEIGPTADGAPLHVSDIRTKRQRAAADESPDSATQAHNKRIRYVDRPAMLSERGYACIALDRPTDPVNIGHALRAVFCYQARLLILGGDTIPGSLPKIVTDPVRAMRHIPVIRADSVLDAVPEGCDIISVELVPDARPLMDFVHPERACYVFGPENGSISAEVSERSRYKVMIPTTTALNLGMTVNTVLYDRLAKSWPDLKRRRARTFDQLGNVEPRESAAVNGDIAA